MLMFGIMSGSQKFAQAFMPSEAFNYLCTLMLLKKVLQMEKSKPSHWLLQKRS